MIPRTRPVLVLLVSALSACATGTAPPTGDGGGLPDRPAVADAREPSSSCIQDPGGYLQDNGLSGLVVHAAKPPPPLSGGTLLITRDQHWAVMSDQDRDKIWIVDLTAGHVSGSISLPAGAEPGRLIEDGSQHVYVVLRGTGNVVALRPFDATTLWTVPVCANPRGVAWDVRMNAIHVACTAGSLVSLSTVDGQQLRQVSVAPDLRDVVAVSTGLLVSSFRSAEVWSVDVNGVVTNVRRPPTTTRLSYSTGVERTDVYSASVGWKLAVQSDGTAVMAHEREMDSAVIPTVGGYYTGAGTFPAVVTSALTAVTPSGQMLATPALGDIVLPVDVACSPDGLLAVVDAAKPLNAGGIRVFPPMLLQTNDPSQTDTFERTNWTSSASGRPVAAAFVRAGLIAVQTREPTQLVLFGPGNTSVAAIAVASDTHEDTGQKIFHDPMGTSVACASCHPEGADDGHVWDFNCDGLRRTQSVRGGIFGTEPFHWDGSLSNFSALTHMVFEHRLHVTAPTEPEIAALGQWIDRLPELPAEPEPANLVAEGQAIFESPAVGCSTCHAGAALTDNQNHDLGLAPFQTPGLKGVRARAPYMHDGCAADLREAILGCGGRYHMGETAALTPSQLTALESYLRSL